MKPRCGWSGKPAMYSSGLSLPKWSSIRKGSRFVSAGVPVLRGRWTPAPSVTSMAETRWRMVRRVMADSLSESEKRKYGPSGRDKLRPVALEDFTDARRGVLAGIIAAQHAAIGGDHPGIGAGKEAPHQLPTPRGA